MTDGQSASQFWYQTHLGSKTRFMLLSDSCGFVCGASTLTRGWGLPNLLCSLGTDHIENTVSSSTFIVACAFISAEMCFVRHCLAVAVSSCCTIQAFSPLVKICTRSSAQLSSTLKMKAAGPSKCWCICTGLYLVSHLRRP
jgi:hypothetical protein